MRLSKVGLLDVQMPIIISTEKWKKLFQNVLVPPTCQAHWFHLQRVRCLNSWEGLYRVGGVLIRIPRVWPHVPIGHLIFRLFRRISMNIGRSGLRSLV